MKNSVLVHLAYADFEEVPLFTYMQMQCLQCFFTCIVMLQSRMKHDKVHNIYKKITLNQEIEPTLVSFYYHN